LDPPKRGSQASVSDGVTHMLRSTPDGRSVEEPRHPALRSHLEKLLRMAEAGATPENAGGSGHSIIRRKGYPKRICRADAFSHRQPLPSWQSVAA